MDENRFSLTAVATAVLAYEMSRYKKFCLVKYYDKSVLYQEANMFLVRTYTYFKYYCFFRTE